MKKWLGLVVGILVALCLSAGSLIQKPADYYVSNAGDDSNCGSFEKPFRTLQKAAEAAGPGSTCYIRAGHYRKPLRLAGKQGSENRPIKFTAYQNERVVLDGRRPLTAEWKPWKGNIYRAKLKGDIWQLFIDDKLVQVARWPNASLNDGTIWDRSKSMRRMNTRAHGGENKSKNGLIYDSSESGNSGQKSLAETGIDFSDAVVFLNTGHWLTWAREVKEHEAGSDHFTYDPNYDDNAVMYGARQTKIAKHCAYYMFGLACLDLENEWWYDKETGMAYLRAPQDADPNDLNIFGRVRDYNLTAESSGYLTFSKLNFFATGMGILNCNDVTFEDCRFQYAGTHKAVLGRMGWFNRHFAMIDPSEPFRNSMPFIANEHWFYEPDSGNVVRNCVFEYCNSPLFFLARGTTIENSLFRYNDWDCLTGGAMATLLVGEDSVVRRNTFHTAGNSEGIRTWGPGTIIELNVVSNMSLLQEDGSAINVGTEVQTGTRISRNWVRNTRKGGVRFDSTQIRYGSGGNYSHNVIWDAKSNILKGDDHLIYNNTIFGGGDKADLQVRSEFGRMSDLNQNSIVRNNLVGVLVSQVYGDSNDVIPGRVANNITAARCVRASEVDVDYFPENYLRDPENLDFRPRKDSPLVDGGSIIEPKELDVVETDLPAFHFAGRSPDVGAYEYGMENYWIPGRLQKQASTPVPPNGSQTAKRDADLIWLRGYRSKKNEIYFGTNQQAIAAADRSSDLYKGSQTNNIFDPGQLEPGATYYWRIDSGNERGRVWNFSVEQP